MHRGDDRQYRGGPAWDHGQRYGGPPASYGGPPASYGGPPPGEWEYQDGDGWQRSPTFEWQQPQPQAPRRHWHGRTALRGFRRSDERIFEDVCWRLVEHPGIDTSDMDVSVHDGEVTLEGTIDDRSEKRLAEDIVESVPGVRDIHNRLRAASHGGDRQPSEIHRGMQVIGVDGRDIGRVKELHGHELLVARSSGPEIGVPLHFVQNTDHDQVVLTIRADEAEAMTDTVPT